jgi:D-arginine dehydrogenase
MTEAAFDIAVIGAGIAGASAAFELARSHSVLILEMEDAPGYHTTGRSAAFFSQAYGAAAMRALTSASLSFYANPPPGFAEHPLLRESGAMYIARSDQHAELDALERAIANSDLVERRDAGFAIGKVGVLAKDYVAECLWEPGAQEIDVHALHHGYLRGARQRGAQLLCGAKLTSAERGAGRWALTTSAGKFAASVIVNAAGAWGDQIAQLAGAAPLGLRPLRRTACIIPAPPGAEIRRWPLVIDVDEEFYFKSDAGNILLSPADETPSEPCDVAPEDIDIAVAVDRFERATTLRVERVLRSWAGLRTVTGDRTLALGFDAAVEGFFSLVGQGGQGIQSAPAAARCVAALIRGEDLPDDVIALGVSAAALSPRRFSS